MPVDASAPQPAAPSAARRLGQRLAWPLWDRGNGRLRAAWRLLVAGVAYTVGQAALSVVLGRAGVWAASAIAGLLVATAGLGLAAWILDRRPLADYGLHLRRAWLRDLAFGLGLGALLMALIFCVELAAGWLVVQDTFVAEGGAPFVRALSTPLALFLAVGVSEELTMRGYLLRNLAEGLRLGRLGPRAAVALAWSLSSLVFGLLHADNPNATLLSTVNLVLAGLFLGLGYVLTGDLALSIGLHITWNLFQASVFGLPVSGYVIRQARVFAVAQRGPALWTGGAFGPEAGLVGLLAMALGCAAIIGWCLRTRGRAALHADLAISPAERRGAQAGAAAEPITPGGRGT